jgi:quinol monooxygenase YgiN
MQIVHVHIHVKPDCLTSFVQATQTNVAASSQEAGIARFEFYQEKDDDTRFILVEVYRSSEAITRHKETAHYAAWRDTVADMMAEPRKGVWYTSINPDDAAWS